MTRYMLTIYQPDGPPPGPDVLDPIMRELAGWNADLRAAGAWVFNAGLHPPSTATVLRKDAGGAVLMTDGPYAEGKEHVGGFTVIEVEDLDAALDWGRRLAGILGLPVEVRPIAG
jgi:hypothetical protein